MDRVRRERSDIGVSLTVKLNPDQTLSAKTNAGTRSDSPQSVLATLRLSG